MKTAEDFRRDLGETDESFRLCIRQTLTMLESKEEEPVKRKFSLGLALVMAVMMLSVTAIADSQWGILSFMRSQGKSATEDQLLTVESPNAYPHGDYEIADAVITEALYDDGTLYLSVTLSPVHENALVLPMPVPNPDQAGKNLNNMSMRDAMKSDAYENISVLDYAKANGFEHVVMMESCVVNMSSTQAYWSKDQCDGIQQTEYRLMEDGTLQFILQVGYRPTLAFAESRRESAGVSMRVYAYDVRGNGKWKYHGSATTNTYLTLREDWMCLRSLPEDAHDIVGYIGAVDFISIEPYDEDRMAITIQTNLGDARTEDTWMSGPAWVIVDGEGNRLCEVDTRTFMSLNKAADEYGDRRSVDHGLFPSEYLPEDGKITLRAENWKNYNIVYDEYTYTLKEMPSAEAGIAQ